MSLFKMWEETKMNKKLPQEWDNWCDFRTWAIANRYKAEYGYKGEFNPKGCLKAMPDYKDGFDVDSVIADEFATEPDKTVYKADFNSLMRLKVDELKELAAKLGIEVGDNATKREMSNLIVERGQL